MGQKNGESFYGPAPTKLPLEVSVRPVHSPSSLSHCFVLCSLTNIKKLEQVIKKLTVCTYQLSRLILSIYLQNLITD